MWEGVYRINEIIPDMHDDPRLNRVYVETDHTLIIEKPTIGKYVFRKQYLIIICRKNASIKYRRSGILFCF